MAQADVDKARAVLQELHDAYIPTVVESTSIGPPSYGFPLGNPAIATITAQSLVFSFSQRDYVRAARSALDAANLTLADVRQGVAEDTAVTYLAIDRDTQRQSALREQDGSAMRLVTIVEDRLNAGQDSAIALTSAKLTEAQIRLAGLRADDEIISDQAHLAQLIGLPAQGLSISSSSIPPLTPPASDAVASGTVKSPAVDSAYAIARAKRETAFGDARYLWRPQVGFAGQYQRFSEFNNYQDYYLHFQQNNAGVGVQFTIPLFDMGHRAKARESAADAAHSEHEADLMRDQFLDSRMRAQHIAAELAVRSEVAELDQQLAQQQLEILLIELKAGTGNSSATQMSPKDEQMSRIAERDKFLAMINASFEMKQAQINLLRQEGELMSWIQSAATITSLPRTQP